MEWKNPNTLPSHHKTAMTTMAFRIDLMELAIGMNWLINHKTTPTTINTNTTWVKGMTKLSFLYRARFFATFRIIRTLNAASCSLVHIFHV